MLLAVLVVTDNEFQIVGAALLKQLDSKSEDVCGRYRSPLSDDASGTSVSSDLKVLYKYVIISITCTVICYFNYRIDCLSPLCVVVFRLCMYLFVVCVQIEHEVLLQIEQWERDTGQMFRINGLPFEAYVKKQHDDFVAEKENEKMLRVSIL